jgi:hypothetical protein
LTKGTPISTNVPEKKRLLILSERRGRGDNAIAVNSSGLIVSVSLKCDQRLDLRQECVHLPIAVEADTILADRVAPARAVDSVVQNVVESRGGAVT